MPNPLAKAPKENKLAGTSAKSKALTGMPGIREQVFLQDLGKELLPLPVSEYYFHNQRKWRFDYCWPDERVVIEVEGGVSKFHKSRHTQAEGYLEDMAKYNAATLAGWRVLRYTWAQLALPQTLRELRQLLDPIF